MSKLRCRHAQSSICEGCYAFLHKVLHKFRWFPKMLKGKIHYLLLTWNIMCFKKLVKHPSFAMPVSFGVYDTPDGAPEKRAR